MTFLNLFQNPSFTSVSHLWQHDYDSMNQYFILLHLVTLLFNAHRGSVQDISFAVI
jgi:hypothetical protein